jgi:hypothetical protein
MDEIQITPFTTFLLEYEYEFEYCQIQYKIDASISDTHSDIYPIWKTTFTDFLYS